MKAEDYVLGVIQKFEVKFPDVFCYAYRDANASEDHRWWLICIDDVNLYMKNETFKNFSKAWRVIGRKNGVRLVFCCRGYTEKILVDLMNKGNLIMNT